VWTSSAHDCRNGCICSKENEGRWNEKIILNPQCTLTGHSGIVDSVQFSDDGLQVISGSEDGTVLVSPIMRARSHDELRGHC
jgi:hypothetical protein